MGIDIKMNSNERNSIIKIKDEMHSSINSIETNQKESQDENQKENQRTTAINRSIKRRLSQILDCMKKTRIFYLFNNSVKYKNQCYESVMSEEKEETIEGGSDGKEEKEKEEEKITKKDLVNDRNKAKHFKTNQINQAAEENVKCNNIDIIYNKLHYDMYKNEKEFNEDMLTIFEFFKKVINETKVEKEQLELYNLRKKALSDYEYEFYRLLVSIRGSKEANTFYSRRKQIAIEEELHFKKTLVKFLQDTKIEKETSKQKKDIQGNIREIKENEESYKEREKRIETGTEVETEKKIEKETEKEVEKRTDFEARKHKAATHKGERSVKKITSKNMDLVKRQDSNINKYETEKSETKKELGKGEYVVDTTNEKDDEKNNERPEGMVLRKRSYTSSFKKINISEDNEEEKQGGNREKRKSKICKTDFMVEKSDSDNKRSGDRIESVEDRNNDIIEKHGTCEKIIEQIDLTDEKGDVSNEGVTNEGVTNEGVTNEGVTNEEEKDKERGKEELDKDVDSYDDQKRILYTWEKIMKDFILRPLKVDVHSFYFKIPVLEDKSINDSIKEEYKLRIKQPMDYTTVGNKLNKGLYKNPNEFHSDILLIYDNCLAFNPQNAENSHLIEAAKSSIEKFNNLWKKSKDKIFTTFSDIKNNVFNLTYYYEHLKEITQKKKKHSVIFVLWLEYLASTNIKFPIFCKMRNINITQFNISEKELNDFDFLECRRASKNHFMFQIFKEEFEFIEQMKRKEKLSHETQEINFLNSTTMDIGKYQREEQGQVKIKIREERDKVSQHKDEESKRAEKEKVSYETTEMERVKNKREKEEAIEVTRMAEMEKVTKKKTREKETVEEMKQMENEKKKKERECETVRKTRRQLEVEKEKERKREEEERKKRNMEIGREMAKKKKEEEKKKRDKKAKEKMEKHGTIKRTKSVTISQTPQKKESKENEKSRLVVHKATSLVDLNKFRKEKGKKTDYEIQRETRQHTEEQSKGTKHNKVTRRETRRYMDEMKKYNIEYIEKNKIKNNEEEDEHEYENEKKKGDLIFFQENPFDNYLNGTTSCMKRVDKHLLVTNCLDERHLWESFKQLTGSFDDSCFDSSYRGELRTSTEEEKEEEKEEEGEEENKEEEEKKKEKREQWKETKEENECTNWGKSKESTLNKENGKEILKNNQMNSHKAISIYLKQSPLKKKLSLFDSLGSQTDDEEIEERNEHDKTKYLELVNRTTNNEKRFYDNINSDSNYVFEMAMKLLEEEQNKRNINRNFSNSYENKFIENKNIYQELDAEGKQRENEVEIEIEKGGRDEKEVYADSISSTEDVESMKNISSLFHFHHTMSDHKKIGKHVAVMSVKEKTLSLDLNMHQSKYTMDSSTSCRLNGTTMYIHNWSENFVCIIIASDFFDLQVKWEKSQHFFEGTSVEIMKMHLLNKAPYNQNIKIYLRNKQSQENELIENLKVSFRKLNSNRIAANVINSYEDANIISDFLSKHRTYVKEIDALVGIELDETTYMISIYVLKNWM